MDKAYVNPDEREKAEGAREVAGHQHAPEDHAVLRGSLRSAPVQPVHSASMAHNIRGASAANRLAGDLDSGRVRR